MRKQSVLITNFILFLSFLVAGIAHAVTVSVPDVSASAGDTFVTSISVDDATGIASGKIVLTFDPNLLTATKVEKTSLTPAPVSNISAGRVTASWASATGIEEGSGALLKITFQVDANAKEGSKSPLTLSEVSLWDEMGKKIATEVIDGTFTVPIRTTIPEKRIVSIPDAQAKANDTFVASINVDNAKGIASGKIILTFDEKVLTATKVEKTSLIPKPVVNIQQGKVIASWASATGIEEGSGTLLSVTFAVNPEAVFGSRSPLTLDEVSLFDETGSEISANGQSGTLTVILAQFTIHIEKGINIVSTPLRPDEPYTVGKFAELLCSEIVIRAEEGDFNTPFIKGVTADDIFLIEGGRGYIILASEAKDVTFTGTAWLNAPSIQTASLAEFRTLWAFAIGGFLYEADGITSASKGYIVTIHNPRTGLRAMGKIGSAGQGRFATAFIDSNKKSVAEAGDILVIKVTDKSGELITGPINHVLKAESLEVGRVVLHLKKGDLRLDNRLFQNFPNPFNPETWIPFQLKTPADVTIKIYAQDGRLVRILALGPKKTGIYTNKAKAAYWDGRNKSGEKVSSGIYFYTIEAGDFRATKKLVVEK